MLPNKSLQGKGLCTYKDTACGGDYPNFFL